jgi:hypothetical protein
MIASGRFLHVSIPAALLLFAGLRPRPRGKVCQLSAWLGGMVNSCTSVGVRFVSAAGRLRWELSGRRGHFPAEQGGAQMTETLDRISDLLHEAGETHHRVFRIVDGADDDWASWYAQWLIDLSELPDLLGVKPVRSELIYLLVGLGRQYAAENPGEPWEGYYARQILSHFRPPG